MQLLYLKSVEIEQLKNEIHPHMLLNSLSLIYRLNQEKNQHTSEAILSLMTCFRYIVRQKDLFVPLHKEITYIQNQQKIQMLTWPDKIRFYMNIPSYLENLPVPAMLLHNFIENATKYAMTENQMLEIGIEADIQDVNQEGFLVICVYDNGPGFSSEILEHLNNLQPIIDQNGRHHIGIINTIRRLDILYNHDAHISFSQREPHGAMISIFLPIQPETGGNVSNESAYCR